MTPQRRARQPRAGLRPILLGGQLTGWLGRPGSLTDPGAPKLGRFAAARANDVYGMISPGLITPSSIARASSASLLGAVRPVAAYFARARLMLLPDRVLAN